VGLDGWVPATANPFELVGGLKDDQGDGNDDSGSAARFVGVPWPRWTLAGAVGVTEWVIRSPSA
jgi:hypothetical protein